MFQSIHALADMIFWGGNKGLTDWEFYELEIAKWQASSRRILQIKGQLYYRGVHDILTRRRIVIGEQGRLQTVGNPPNSRIIDNQYAKLVRRKANYIAGNQSRRPAKIKHISMISIKFSTSVSCERLRTP